MLRGHWCLRVLFIVAAAVLASCGEQDLYRPPESPFRISGRVSLPTQAQDVDILGNYAYVAAGQSGLQVVDISSPEDPRLVLWLDTPKFADAVAVARTYDPDGSIRDFAFLVEGTEGIIPYDITYVPDSLIDLRQGTTAYAGNAVCVALPDYVTDSYELYLADSWRAITGFVSDPQIPGFLDQRARIEPRGYAEDLAMSSDQTHVFVADDEMGVTVVDASRVYARELTVVANTDTPGNARGIAVAGDFIFVAAGEAGLQILRADANYVPQPIAALALAGTADGIAVRDGTAFLAARDAGLLIVDVRDPYHPVLLGSVPTSYANGVAAGAGNIVCIADRDEGLVVFRGPELPPDFTPPAAVGDLAARLTDTTAVQLTWTAPGDDGSEGTAHIYHLYWSPDPFDDTLLEQATEIPRRPVPQVAGTPQTTSLAGLTPGAQYYFALQAEDEARNLSPLSPLAHVIMTAPRLRQGQVEPDSADVSTTFTYRVVYQDAEGDAPAVMTVVIDGTSHVMTQAGGGDYVTGVVFEYATLLSLGSHDYQFTCDDGHGPLVKTPVFSGPRTPPDPFAFVMVPVPVGGGVTFAMGSPALELGRDEDEQQHPVTLTRDYVIGEAEVTQGTYAALMGTNPSGIVGDARPVENVTFFDALRFCNAFSVRNGYAPAYTLSAEVTDAQGHVTAAQVTWDPLANGYRLPTEAEWEYACRAGATTALANGALNVEHCESDVNLDALGWYCGNSDTGLGPQTHDGRSKAVNGFGLYDLHGNVWEWCWDIYGTYPDGAVSDPSGPAGADWQQRVRRGGSWYYFARDCRSASRDAYWPGSRDNTLGFRIARNSE